MIEKKVICGRSTNIVHAKPAVVNAISTSIHEELVERSWIIGQRFEQHITWKLPSDTKVPRLENGKKCKAAELRSGKKLPNPYLVPTRGGEEQNRSQCMEENEDGQKCKSQLLHPLCQNMFSSFHFLKGSKGTSKKRNFRSS